MPLFRERRYLNYLVIPTPWVIGAIIFLASAHKYKEMSSREQTTSGTIILHEVQNHNRFGYRFQIDGKATEAGKLPSTKSPRLVKL
jgi:hypothetical protein